MPARDLEHVLVADAMRRRLIAVRADEPLHAVARLMAAERVHAVLVDPQVRPARVVTATDVARRAADADAVTAGEAAGPPAATVSADRSLAEAAALMGDREIAHLVVLDPASGQAVGMLSTLDVATVLAWGTGPPALLSGRAGTAGTRRA